MPPTLVEVSHEAGIASITMDAAPEDPAPRQARPARLAAAGVGVVLGALLLVLAAATWQGVGGIQQGGRDVGGAAAADFTLERFDGETFHLAEYSGQPVFVYFWASWCAPCVEEAPVIEALWPEYRERGFVFLGINIWDLEADARRFVDELGLSFPLARDTERAVYVEYGVQGLPVAFFIEPGLQIRSRYDGPLDEATLRSELERIAGGSS
jgi:cytochrome c biogenesis protein CcmG, thiol:disulfide interchange protein DsbE